MLRRATRRVSPASRRSIVILSKAAANRGEGVASASGFGAVDQGRVASGGGRGVVEAAP
jgi:hypothetical protein